MDSNKAKCIFMETRKKHLQAVKNAKKKIDNDPPLLNPTKYFSRSKFSNQKGKIHEIMQMNKKLLININTCYRSTRNVDESEMITKKLASAVALRAMERETYLKNIMQENLQMRNRIMEAASFYKQEIPKRKPKRRRKLLGLDAESSIGYKSSSILDKWSILPEGEISNPKLRKTCFFDITIDNLKRGRLLFEIYCDIVPKTADKFISLCEAEYSPTYRKTVLHQVFSGCFCLGGEVNNFSPEKNDEIVCFPDENYILEHAGPGVISMFSYTPTINSTHFLITFKKLSTLNGRFVVIGRLKTEKSLELLEMIEEFGTKTGNTKKKVIISECGVL